RVRRLVAERDAALELLATLAAALGACEVCLGEDARCEECNGEGGPGWAEPDPELYEAWVAPAVGWQNPAADGTHRETARDGSGPHTRETIR
ncbi:MAG TPA: hypothetical protein VJP77_00345, partial [Planctomycetota bacterium]|nr:hypothetical protein [Planctomycetota bacterium]